MRLVLLGAPGSGKGTQAKLLQSRLGIAHISTGDLLRAAVAAATPLGVQVKAIMDAGELVSDDLVLALLKERLAEPDCSKGFILDGYPRNTAQADALERILHSLDLQLDAVALITVDEDLLLKRLTGRVSCSGCGAVFNRYTNPPRIVDICDACGEPLHHRSDDNEDTVRKRLMVYAQQTAPLVEYYTQRGVLKRIDGDGELKDVQQRLVTAVGAA